MNDPQKIARQLRSDSKRVLDTYHCSKEMVDRARSLIAELVNQYLVRLVDVTELRLESYFHKELKVY